MDAVSLARVSSARDLRRLHGAVGNRAVGRLLARAPRGDTAPSLVYEAELPMAWAERAPDWSAMSRVELFDAKRRLDAWYSSHRDAPLRPRLERLRKDLAARIERVASPIERATLKHLSKVEPDRLRERYLQVLERIVEDRGQLAHWDLDTADEVVRARDPSALWPPAARGLLGAILAEQDREAAEREQAALAARREQDRRSARHAGLLWPLRAQFDRAEAQASRLPPEAYELWRELAWLWIDQMDAGVDPKARERRAFDDLSGMYEALLRDADAAIQSECRARPEETGVTGAILKLGDRLYGDPCKPWFVPFGHGENELAHFKRLLRIKRHDDPFLNAYYWTLEYQRAFRLQTDPQAQLDQLQAQALASMISGVPSALGRYGHAFKHVVAPFARGRLAGLVNFTMMGRMAPNPAALANVGPVSRHLRTALRNTVLGVRLAVKTPGSAPIGHAAPTQISMRWPDAPKAPAAPRLAAPGPSATTRPPGPPSPAATPQRPVHQQHQTSGQRITPQTNEPTPAATPSRPVEQQQQQQQSGPRLPVNRGPSVRDYTYRSKEEVAAAIVKKLSVLRHGMALRDLPREWGMLLKALNAHHGQVNQEILELLPIVMGGLRDIALFAEVLADAWERARDADTDINTALLAMARETGTPIQTIAAKPPGLSGAQFFVGYASKEAYIDDQANRGNIHRSLSHLLQDLVVDRALKRAGRNLTSPQFRAKLGRVEGVLQRHEYGTIDLLTWRGDETVMPTGDYVWRFTYDLYLRSDDRHMPQPEEIGPILAAAIGLR